MKNHQRSTEDLRPRLRKLLIKLSHDGARFSRQFTDPVVARKIALEFDAMLTEIRRETGLDGIPRNARKVFQRQYVMHCVLANPKIDSREINRKMVAELDPRSARAERDGVEDAYELMGAVSFGTIATWRRDKDFLPSIDRLLLDIKRRVGPECWNEVFVNGPKYRKYIAWRAQSPEAPAELFAGNVIAPSPLRLCRRCGATCVGRYCAAHEPPPQSKSVRKRPGAPANN
jgi:hypothetical protein